MMPYGIIGLKRYNLKLNPSNLIIKAVFLRKIWKKASISYCWGSMRLNSTKRMCKKKMKSIIFFYPFDPMMPYGIILLKCRCRTSRYPFLSDSCINEITFTWFIWKKLWRNDYLTFFVFSNCIIGYKFENIQNNENSHIALQAAPPSEQFDMHT